MEVHIRQATPGDTAGIARVHVDSWRSSYKGIVPQEILSGLSYDERRKLWDNILNSSQSDTYCFVAESQRAQIIGFAYGGLNRECSPNYEGEIYSIYLLQDYQRGGIGRRLLLAVAECLIDGGIGSMLLWVFERNHSARRFYESLGGKAVRRKKLSIGGARVVEVAYGWNDIASLVR